MPWYECVARVHGYERNIEADDRSEAEGLMEDYFYGDFAQGKVDFDITIELVKS